MRILVFEFITGGGLNHKTLPQSLVQEGALMRLALLFDLDAISGIEIRVMHDQRLPLDNFLLENRKICIHMSNFGLKLCKNGDRWKDAFFSIGKSQKHILGMVEDFEGVAVSTFSQKLRTFN